MSNNKFKFQYTNEENFELAIEDLKEQIKHFDNTASVFSFTRLMFRFERAEMWAKQCIGTRAKMDKVFELNREAHSVLLKHCNYYTVNAYNFRGRTATRDIRILAVNAEHACARYMHDYRDDMSACSYACEWAIEAYNRDVYEDVATRMFNA